MQILFNKSHIFPGVISMGALIINTIQIHPKADFREYMPWKTHTCWKYWSVPCHGPSSSRSVASRPAGAKQAYTDICCGLAPTWHPAQSVLGRPSKRYTKPSSTELPRSAQRNRFCSRRHYLLNHMVHRGHMTDNMRTVIHIAQR